MNDSHKLGVVYNGCSKCMDHKPYPGRAFACPVCGQHWALANVWPGNYYEPVDMKS